MLLFFYYLLAMLFVVTVKAYDDRTKGTGGIDDSFYILYI